MENENRNPNPYQPEMTEEEIEMNTLSTEEVDAIGDFRINLGRLYKRAHILTELNPDWNDIEVSFTPKTGKKRVHTVIFNRKTLRWRLD